MTAMLETGTEAIPTDTVGGRPPASRQSDLFRQAIHYPADDFVPVTSHEIQIARRRGNDEASIHFLTSVLLRFAKDDTTIDDFVQYEQAKQSDAELNKRSRKSSQEVLTVSAKTLLAARDKAAPYAGMLAAVQSTAGEYRSAYERSGESMTERREFVNQLYDETDYLKHPGVMYIHDLGNEARELAIESERVLRYILSTEYGPIVQGGHR